VHPEKIMEKKTPTGESHPEGGYEMDVAPLAHRDHGLLQAQCGILALETTNAMLNALWSRNGNR